MDFASFEQLASERFPALAAEVEAYPGTLEIHEEACPNPLLRGGIWLADHALATEPGEGDRLPRPDAWRISLFYGSFVEAAGEGHDDWASWTDQVLEEEVAAIAALLSTHLALPTEQALFTEHAQWRRGEPTHDMWYRLGEPIDVGLWAVDLDLFCELRLRAAEWDRLVGQSIEITLGDEQLPVELPADMVSGEELILEAAGLVEDSPELLAALEAGDEVDEELVRQGDLVIVARRGA